MARKQVAIAIAQLGDMILLDDPLRIIGHRRKRELSHRLPAQRRRLLDHWFQLGRQVKVDSRVVGYVCHERFCENTANQLI